MITEYGQAWDPDNASINLGNSGPIRVLTNDVDEDVEVRPVGFNTIATALVTGMVRPGPRLRVYKRAGWWRWRCPWCPTKVGGLLPTWAEALTAGRAHAARHCPECGELYEFTSGTWVAKAACTTTDTVHRRDR